MKGRTQQYNDEKKLELIKQIQALGRVIVREHGDRKIVATDWQGKKLK